MVCSRQPVRGSFRLSFAFGLSPLVSFIVHIAQPVGWFQFDGAAFRNVLFVPAACNALFLPAPFYPLPPTSLGRFRRRKISPGSGFTCCHCSRQRTRVSASASRGPAPRGPAGSSGRYFWAPCGTTRRARPAQARWRRRIWVILGAAADDPAPRPAYGSCRRLPVQGRTGQALPRPPHRLRPLWPRGARSCPRGWVQATAPRARRPR